MSRAAALLVVLVAATAALPARGATQLPYEAGQAWTHPETKLAFPATLDRLDLVRVDDFGDTLSDVALTYRDKSDGTTATVYLFRAGVPDVSLWMDRVATTIEGNTRLFDSVDRAHRIWTRFTPTTGGIDSGLRVAYPVTGHNTRASGAAFLRFDAWLVGLRLTSAGLDSAALDQRIARVMGLLPARAAKRPAPPAYEIEPCADALPTANATIAPTDLAAAFVGAALTDAMTTTLRENGKPEEPDAPAHYCRDPASNTSYAVYRDGSTRDSYVIGAGDGGVSITVERSLAGALLGKGAPNWSVTLLTNDMAYGFEAYKSLPSPTQAVSVLETGKPRWSHSRVAGKTGNINVTVPGK